VNQYAHMFGSKPKTNINSPLEKNDKAGIYVSDF